MPVVERPDLHVARVRDDLVVLDLARGAYDLAPGLFVGALGSADAETRVLDVLGARPAPPLEPLDGPATGEDRPWLQNLDLDPSTVEVRRRDRGDAASAWVALVLTYPGAPLRRLTTPAGGSGGPLRADETRRRAAVFARLLPWAPWPGACLFRAYLLRLFLRRGGCDASWVFGVRTWPFRAHCWLEADGVVLNDDAASIRAYSPILRT